MKKLFTGLYGSSLYGTNGPESDRDVRHIVLPDIDDLLLGRKIVTVEKKTNQQKNTKNTKDDVDEKFIPLQVFANEFLNGQTEALELAFSIEGDHTEQTFYGAFELQTKLETMKYYRDRGDDAHRTAWMFHQFVLELREKFLTSNMRSLVSYVVNQSKLYSLKGTRLNACRSLREVLEDIEEVTPEATLGSCMETHSRLLFMGIEATYPSCFSIGDYDASNENRAPCFRILGKVLPHTNTVRHTLGTVDTLITGYGDRVKEASKTEVDWKATMHAMRIVDEGIELLTYKRLQFPLPQAQVERLLKIRRGEEDIVDIKEEFNRKVDLIAELEKVSDIHKYSEELKSEFNVWLTQWLHKFYGVS